MGKLRLSTVVEIDSSHYLKDYEGKCANLHGHRWKIEVILEGQEEDLDKAGMLCDFGIIKDILNRYDHAVMVYEPNPDLISDTLELFSKLGFTRVKTFDFNTTAENLAVYWAEEIMLEFARMGLKSKVVELRVWETPNNRIDYLVEG